MDEPGGSVPALVLALRDRGGDAFVKALARYGPLIRWRLMWQQNLSEAEAEEIATEVIEDVAMWKIDSYEGDGYGFAAWLLAIAVNTARSRRRKEGGMRSEPIPATLAAPAHLADEAPEDRDDANGPYAQRIQALYEGIRQLSSDDQAMLRMAYGAEAKTWGEIAEHFGITVDAAKVRGCRARSRLKKIVTTTEGRENDNGGERHAQRRD